MMLDYVNFTCFNNVMVIGKATYLQYCNWLCKEFYQIYSDKYNHSHGHRHLDTQPFSYWQSYERIAQVQYTQWLLLRGINYTV